MSGSGQEEGGSSVFAAGTSEQQAWDQVLAFVDEIVLEAQTHKKTVPEVLLGRFPEDETTHEGLVKLVPLGGADAAAAKGSYYSFDKLPSQSKVAGRIHISSLSFCTRAYHGGGHYASTDVRDYMLLLRESGFGSAVLDIQPVRQTDLKIFGWGCDGALASSTAALTHTMVALSFLAKQNTPGYVELPKSFAHALANLRARYTKHQSKLNRMVSTISSSATQHRINRSPRDPCFLAKEFQRLAMASDGDVTAFFKRYNELVVPFSPAKKMESHVEQVVKKLLNPSKIGAGAEKLLQAITLEWGWDSMPLSISALNTPEFCQGAALSECGKDGALGQLVVQSAQGQQLAMLAVQQAGPTRKWPVAEFKQLCRAAGFTANFTSVVGPAMLLGEEHLHEMEQDFLTDAGGFRAGVLAACDSLGEMEMPQQQKLAHLSHLCDYLSKSGYIADMVAKQKRRFGEQPLVSTSQSQSAQQDLETNKAKVFLAQLSLDINMYLSTKESLEEAHETKKKAISRKRKAYVDDVRLVQDDILGSKIIIHKAKAAKHRRGATFSDTQEFFRSSISRISASVNNSVAVLHIIDLAAFGVVKTGLLKDLDAALSATDGLILIEHPTVPSLSFQSKVTSFRPSPSKGGWDAFMEDGFGVSGSAAAQEDEDLPMDLQGLDRDGHLPLSVTAAVEKLSSEQRAASLASDQFEILSVLGFSSAAKDRRYPKNVTLTFRASSSSQSIVRHGILLVPLDILGGRREGDDITGLSKTTLQTNGSFVDLPTPTAFINTSEQQSAKLRRVMNNPDDWRCPAPIVNSAGRVSNKSIRTQNGADCYVEIIRDCLNNTSKKAVIVCDWATSVGDRACAAVRCLSSAGGDDRAELFYCGTELRHVFYETALARVRHEIGQAYVDGKMEVSGHTPLPEPETTDMNMADTRSSLAEKMKIATVDAAGELVLPLLPENIGTLPFQVNPTIEDMYQKFMDDNIELVKKSREIWNTKVVASNEIEGEGTEEKTATATGSTTTANASKVANAGAILEANCDIISSFQLPTSKEVKVVLARMKSDHSELVCLWNPSASVINLPKSTFVGRGGPGEFVDGNDNLDALVPGGWLFNRLVDFKKDVPSKASGGMVIAKSEDDIGPIGSLQMVTTHKFSPSAEVNVYAHKLVKGAAAIRIAPSSNPIMFVPEHKDGKAFGVENLGCFFKPKVGAVPSHVVASTIPPFEGIVRSAFAMVQKGSVLEPVPNNPLTIWTSALVKIEPHTLVQLV